MCGIAGIHRLTDKPFPKLNRFADELLKEIEGRGPDSTGFLALLDSGKVQTERAVARASRFVKRRPKFSEDARTVMLHTRLATVGTVSVRNAHPVISGSCAAVHNGTIQNATSLFKTFGLKRRAQVDSEIIPALIDHAGWECAGAAIELLRGGAATAVISADHPRELLLARTHVYPLVWFKTADFIVWASTERAIVSAWHFTFKAKPPRGEWGRLGDWSMLRVNGHVELHRLDRPDADLRKPKRAKATPAGKSTKSTAKRRRKAGRNSPAPGQRTNRAPRTAARSSVSPSPGLRLPSPTPTYPRTSPLYREPWDEETVRDLMRWSGMNQGEAEAAIFGTEPEPEGWQERMWADDLSAAVARERGFC